MARRKIASGRIRVLLGATLAVSPGHASASWVPSGGDRLLTPTGITIVVDAAAFEDGRLFAIGVTQASYYGSGDLIGTVLDGAGRPLIASFPIHPAHARGSGLRSNAAAAVDATGRMVATWLADDAVHLAAWTPTGEIAVPAFVVGPVLPASGLSFMRLVPDATGGILVVWVSGGFIYGRSFTAALDAAAPLWAVPAAARTGAFDTVRLSNGQILLLWQAGGYPELCRTFATVVEAHGSVVTPGTEIGVANSSCSGVAALAVESPSPRVLIALSSFPGSVFSGSLMVFRYSEALEPLAAPVEISTDVYQGDPYGWRIGPGEPSLAGRDSGAMVVWTSGDENKTGLWGRSLDLDGIPDGAAFPINEWRVGYQGTSIVVGHDGGYSVLWHGLYEFESRVRQFCDSTSVECSRCADATSDDDTDFDGLSDECDFCSNSQQSGFVRAKWGSKANVGIAGAPGFTLGALVNVPPSTLPLDELGLDQNGAWLSVRGAAGSDIVSVGIPGAALTAGRWSEGWALLSGGTGWRFRGNPSPYFTAQTGSGLVLRMMLKERRTREGRFFKLKIAGRARRSPAVPGVLDVDLPLELSLTLGSSYPGDGTTCHELVFAAEDCRKDALTPATRCTHRAR